MASRTNKNWSRKETLIAFNLFCKTRFGRIHARNPDIVKLAEKLGRSANAVAMKTLNLASFDPNLRKRKISSLQNVSKMDKQIWEEFNNNSGAILIESQLLADQINDVVIVEEILQQIASEDTRAFTLVRPEQQAFRKTILAAYNEECCITGISEPKLLIASHIIPWREKVERLNPRNGLCLNALHDKAYDRGLISVRPDFSVAISKRLHEVAEKSEKIKFIVESEGQKITQPEKFAPDPRFLKHHYKKIYLDAS